jgi:hypothetical protein
MYLVVLDNYLRNIIFLFCSGQDGQNGGYFDYFLSTLFISPPYMSNDRGYLSHLFDLFFSLSIKKELFTI